MVENDKGFVLKEDQDKSGDEKSKSDSSQGGKSEFQMPEMTFSTFLMSLNASALVNLGVIDDPTSKKKDANIPAAKQTIDIICLLEEKTKGNLTEDEAAMVKNILYDLRIIYIKETKSGK